MTDRPVCKLCGDFVPTGDEAPQGVCRVCTDYGLLTPEQAETRVLIREKIESYTRAEQEDDDDE